MENNLGEVGGTAVAKALETNKSLQKLRQVPWHPISICLGGALDKLDTDDSSNAIFLFPAAWTATTSAK